MTRVSTPRLVLLAHTALLSLAACGSTTHGQDAAPTDSTTTPPGSDARADVAVAETSTDALIDVPSVGRDAAIDAIVPRDTADASDASDAAVTCAVASVTNTSTARNRPSRRTGTNDRSTHTALPSPRR